LGYAAVLALRSYQSSAIPLSRLSGHSGNLLTAPPRPLFRMPGEILRPAFPGAFAVEEAR